MSFEKPLPEWNAEGVEPPQTLKNEGWGVDQKPPADYFNWFFYVVSNALKELQEKGYTKDEVMNLINSIETFSGDYNDLINQPFIPESPDDIGAASKTEHDQLKQNFGNHQKDNEKHITKSERTDWNAKETPDGARKKVEQTDYDIVKSGKDSNGIFTKVEYYRPGGNKAKESVLSGGTSPQYTRRTVTYYGLDGVTVERRTYYTLYYDADGDLINEVSA